MMNTTDNSMDPASYTEVWEKIAKLKPEIRNHTAIRRHVYRNQVQYVLENDTTGQLYRFSPVVYRLVGMMNGKNSVQKLWERMNQYYGDEAPERNEIVQLLSQLNAAGTLNLQTPIDINRLMIQPEKESGAALSKKMQGNLLFFRVALADPEKFLVAIQPYIRVLFSKMFFLISLFLIAAACLQLVLHWQSFSTDVFERLLTLENSFLLILIYPVVKGVHELAHAFAVKIRGGEVHEMGVMVLVFMPLPYVDASSASAFQSKWRRIVVGFAGIFVELILAALAVLFWVSAEPGILRTIAFNVIVKCGASTLLFNGNPLVKFDGYYILSDLIEIPNLGQRSLRYIGYLVKKYLLGVQGDIPPESSLSEKIWLTVYGVSSFLYRIAVIVSIIWYVSLKFMNIGILLGVYGCVQMVIRPVMRKIIFVYQDPACQQFRRSILLRISGILMCLIAFFMLVPFPHLDIMEGVVWLPEDAHLRPGGDGVVSRIVARPDSQVQRGDLLIECVNSELNGRLAVLESQLREYRLRYGAAIAVDTTEAQMIREQIAPLKRRVARYREQIHDMTIFSPSDGRFVLPDSQDLQGRFVHKGELLGYVISDAINTVRVAVVQKDLELVRSSRRDVEVKAVADKSTTLYGEVLRELPGATNRLPSGVLGTAGGGGILVDPSNESGLTPLQNVFLLDIQLKKPLVNVAPDKRVLVRFNYGVQPIGFRMFRQIQQLFLGRHNL